MARSPFTKAQEARIAEMIEARFTVQRRLDAVRHQHHWAEDLRSVPPHQQSRRLV